MNYITITTINAYEANPLRSYSLFGRKFGIFRSEDGGYYGLETNCKHQGADLLQGRIVGNVVTCPWHDWRYDLSTGECLDNDSPPLRRYEILVEGETLKIAITLRDE